MNKSNYWLQVLTKLRVDRSKGIAPHKPLLLLVLLEIVEEGELQGDALDLSPQLAFRFSQFWSIVAHRRSQRPDIRLPFFYLKSDGLWQTFAKDGSRSEDMKSTRKVHLTPDFLAQINEREFRSLARAVLIRNYFEPEEQISLASLVNLPIPEIENIPFVLREKDIPYQTGRDVRFRLDIVAAYNYTCALTGYRVTTIDGASIIDAAHIHQFSESRNNDPKNGIALCKNAHWMFDQGLWSLGDDYRVIVAHSAFDEDTRDQKSLLDFHGLQIALPTNKELRPDPQHLAWHREYKFCALSSQDYPTTGND